MLNVLGCCCYSNEYEDKLDVNDGMLMLFTLAISSSAIVTFQVKQFIRFFRISSPLYVTVCNTLPFKFCTADV